MKQKLVVCDVDGTLLKKGQKEIDFKTITAIEMLCEKNYFAVASGRSYTELLKLFEKVKDKIYFICLDGAVLIYKNEVIFKMPLSSDKINKMYSLYADKENINLLLYGDKNSYAVSGCEIFMGYIRKIFGENVLKINSLNDIKTEIYKISAVTLGSPVVEKNDIYIKNNRLLRKIYEDKHWNDYIRCDADKLKAIDFLKKELNVSYENTVVFGDNYNDSGLLRAGQNSFVLSTAPQEVKKIAKYETDEVLPELLRLGGEVK